MMERSNYKRMQLDKVPTTRAALVSELGRSQTLVVIFWTSAMCRKR